MKTIFLSTLILLSTSPQAQVASGSLFRSMKSENPAVISERPAATIALNLKKDSVDKKQEPTGPITSSVSDIEITTSSFFYGGKGGKGITTEIYAELGSGTKEDTVTIGSDETQKAESDLTVLNFSAGFMDFLGLGVMNISSTNKQSGSIVATSETSLMIYTVGAKFDLGLDLGVFYQHAPLDSPGSAEVDMSRIGVGTGFSSKNIHFEVAYIKNLKEEKELLGGGGGPGDENYATHNPAKIMGSLEFKLGKISLGITSNYYIEGFFDFHNLMYYTMVMSSNKENRLENTFNFSLGGEKGHSFSGSVTIASVESTEVPPTLLSGDKYKTTTDILGFQLSYSYAF